jgi:uncharacterized protein (DUF3084 family)
VLKPWNAPFLGSPVALRRFLENRIQISRGKSPAENITWFRYGEIRSTTNLDSSPQAPQKKTVRIDRIIHGARMDETRRGVLGNACSFVLISAISDLEFQGICQIREFDRLQAGIDARPWLAI